MIEIDGQKTNRHRKIREKTDRQKDRYTKERKTYRKSNENTIIKTTQRGRQNTVGQIERLTKRKIEKRQTIKHHQT